MGRRYRVTRLRLLELAALTMVVAGALTNPSFGQTPNELRCYQVAASQDDQGLPGGLRGVAFNAVNTGVAVPLCTAAWQQFAGLQQKNSRLAFTTGRAYHAQRRYDLARSFYTIAANDNFSLAAFNLGTLWEGGQGGAVNLVEAYRLYRLAGDLGYAPGLASANRLAAQGSGDVSGSGAAPPTSVARQAPQNQSVDLTPRNPQEPAYFQLDLTCSNVKTTTTFWVWPGEALHIEYTAEFDFRRQVKLAMLARTACSDGDPDSLRYRDLGLLQEAFGLTENPFVSVWLLNRLEQAERAGKLPKIYYVGECERRLGMFTKTEYDGVVSFSRERALEILELIKNIDELLPVAQKVYPKVSSQDKKFMTETLLKYSAFLAQCSGATELRGVNIASANGATIIASMQIAFIDVILK